MSDKPVDKTRAELAVNYLANTDAQLAELKTDARRAELRIKKTKAAIFLTSSGNIEERKATSETDNETKLAEEDWLAAEQKYEELKNRRDSAELVFEMWRSLNSARTKGIVV